METKDLLCKHMNMSADEYSQLVFDNAYAYLNRIIPNDQLGMDLLTKSKAFWAWWQNQWNRRDRIFIREIDLHDVQHIVSPDASTLMRELYFETHSVEGITVFPSRMILEESYAVMIGQVFKERSYK